MAKAAKTAKPNVFVRFANYLRDVVRELKRVVWPGRSEVYSSSLVVIVTVLFFVVFTFAVDQGTAYLVALVGKIGG